MYTYAEKCAYYLKVLVNVVFKIIRKDSIVLTTLLNLLYVKFVVFIQ